MTESDLKANIRLDTTKNNDGNNNDDDDDVPYLSADTFKALQEFYSEKEAIEKSIDENWVNE